MGFIRGSLLVIVSVVLFLLFIIGNLFLTFSFSLDYDNVRLEFVSVTQDIIEDMDLPDVVEEQLELMESHCQDNSEFVFSEGGNTFVIPCDVISQGSEAIISSGVDSLVEEVYYKEYDCDFWDCFEKTGSPSFLVSEKARVYWNTKFYMSLLIAIVLIALMFFLIEKKTSLPFIVGSLLVVSSLPFMKLDSLIGILVNPTLAMTGFSDMPINLFDILSVFFSKAYNVFWIMFITGITILLAGVILKLFKVGFKISEFFSKKNINEKGDKSKGVLKKEKNPKNLKEKSK
ncbi:hypothetical protein KAR52_03125 [Candidatus Pacearchaeota archaeon]|nr:hypothetical protein [Candidatus Pacearchaeota archaeon]